MDTDCFPDEIVVFDNPINTRLLVLGSQTKSSNTPTDSSVDIEADGLVVKGCKGGTAGEVPGKPGVCKRVTKLYSTIQTNGFNFCSNFSQLNYH